jgi:hypothetical protein
VLENGDVVAVKKLVSMPGVNDVQFENEVYHLLMLKNKNIVRFLGYCFETRHVCILHNGRYCFAEMPEKLLCLEYLPNGSLDRHISGKFEYLHTYNTMICREVVYHADVDLQTKEKRTHARILFFCCVIKTIRFMSYMESLLFIFFSPTLCCSPFTSR